MNAMPDGIAPRLSLCIATFRRADYIAETIEAIARQATPDVELVVVDGASPDATPDVMASLVRRYDWIRYVRETENSGVDRDFDKAVGYARGEHCWLMSDDDLLVPGALARVLERLAGGDPDLLIVNAEIRNADFGVQLAPRYLDFTEDRRYGPADRERFFAEVADYLSFIGGVVIRRELWLGRRREPYYGSLFIHVGVIFQAPLAGLVEVLADPLVVIRYGNAMWSARGFEIWMFKWPGLIWSFTDIDEGARARVVAARPWQQPRRLVFYRAIGAYSMAEYRAQIVPRCTGRARWLPWFVAACPARLLNGLGALWWYWRNRRARAGIYDLARSRHATAVSRWVAAKLRIAPV